VGAGEGVSGAVSVEPFRYLTRQRVRESRLPDPFRRGVPPGGDLLAGSVSACHGAGDAAAAAAAEPLVPGQGIPSGDACGLLSSLRMKSTAMTSSRCVF
jgi:hypothetical protein